VPLYSGDISVNDDFNRTAFINYQDFKRTEIFLHDISWFDTDFGLYKAMYEQPLLNQAPSLDKAIQFIRSIT